MFLLLSLLVIQLAHQSHTTSGAFTISPFSHRKSGISTRILDSINAKNEKIKSNTKQHTKRINVVSSSSQPTTITTSSRRDTIRLSLLASSYSLLLATVPINYNIANAFEPLTLFYHSSDSDSYQPANRATAYLVDSTIPPTLVPFRAAREAAILKNLGKGGGTKKSAFIEEEITTNNIMNKVVFGTINFIKNAFALDDDDDNDDISDSPPTVAATSQDVDGDQSEEKKKSKKKNKAYDSTFVFLGVDYANTDEKDAKLAIEIIKDIITPRRDLDTSLALEYAPISTQDDLNAYIESVPSSSSESVLEGLVQALLQAQVPQSTIKEQLPILEFAKFKSIPLVACAPESNDVTIVRRQGLQNIDPNARSRYVFDSNGFIEWTQNPKNKLYTDRSLLKDFVPENEQDGVASFFAERILVHETVATTIARYSLTRPSKSLILVIIPQKDVRFLGGPNGRIARIVQALNPKTNVDEDAVTTILLNPTAEKTLSQSKFLRLEIGNSPENIMYQTKVADYLWFSSMPKVNMLPRMMNGY